MGKAMRLLAAVVIGGLAVSVCAISTRAATASETPQVDPAQNDAQLADVCFVDAEHGWAVGDRGAIWHTDDGGAHWTLQPSGVEARLDSVFFVDKKIGWAGGGFTQPYTRATRGVLLHTRDGGERWIADHKLILPAIRKIRFFDPDQGWTLSEPSAYFPSGVQSTSDGGRSWHALPAAEARGWLAADLIDPDTGAVAGRSSALATVRRRGIETLPPDFGLRALRQLKLTPPAGGWLVGDGGLVLRTHDLGKSWQTPEGGLPAGLAQHFDFSALEVRGDDCWVAGTPGTRVVHSGDGGRTWQSASTGQTLPIRALTFVDQRSGWAVGDLGTILGTEDGGKTWRRQRGGGARSAYLGFYGRADELPLELVARLSADDGYLGAMEILNRQDALGAATADPATLAHEAGVRAGASVAESAWRFPLRAAGLKLSAEQLVEGWNQANDGGALEKLEAHVVARIRMWRPSVVFMPSSDARSGDPLAHVINQVVLRASERAGDAAQFPDQISEAGLQPWKVQKVYATLPPGQGGTANVNTAQLAPRLGRSIGELAAPARGVLAGEAAAPAVNLGFRLLVDHIPQGAGQRDFFSGIPLSPGGEARRPFEDRGDNNLDAMRREAQLRRNLQAILTRADEKDSRDGRFLADIGQQTRDLDPARAAEIVFQLGDRYARNGRWELAAECYELVVDRYPRQPLAASSLIWLVQYYASGEAAWRNRAAQTVSVVRSGGQPPALDAAGGGASGGVRAAGGSGTEGGVRQASAISAPSKVERGGALVTNLQQADDRLAKAAGYARQLEANEPLLYGEPTIRFPLAVADRQRGFPRQSERFYLALRHGRPHDAWWACAQSELWLAERKAQPPKSLWSCARAANKPRLDGRLDDPLWRAGNVVELRSAGRDDADWRAVAMLAYDDEFLYFAASCSQSPGFKYVKSDEPRPRDGDLSDQDRIELLLDVDRDFATYYRLAVDHRGWTAESCWHDKTWNPEWFVAHGGGDGVWTVEAAIPLSELTGTRPAASQAWAVGVQRVVSGAGFQSWTEPATPEITPEGFGLLIFQ